ncbi:hypothetical protein [Desulfurobacterium sp.]|uniref:hypothetical protein n=1 Tax=Desulfurobacterium sp. TaxID=2004706 RepID=UPI002633C699|nr:hypothetical protein [Desulfurobacterium sp.]
MDIAENDLIELLKEFDIFERNRISLKIKLTAISLESFSLSFSLNIKNWNIALYHLN